MVAATPLAAAAQARVPGFRETQVWAAGVASHPGTVVAGLGLASRDAQRTRIGAALAGGIAEGGAAAARLELTWHFLLDPARRKGLGVYGGGGVALAWMENDKVRPYLQVALGAETAPVTSSSFFVEAGFGGGARFALGWRWRKRRTAQRVRK